MSDFHFLRPTFLFVSFPLILLLLLFFYRQKNASSWHRICKKDLLPYILISERKSKVLAFILSSMTLLLLSFALAGPSWDQVVEPVFKRQSSLVIVLDLSEPMNAADIKPSRLKRAIYKINDLLDLRKDGQTALIVFSADPYVVTPLTDDIATIQAQLPVLETKIMPKDGHRVHLAILKALDLLNQTGVNEGSILLVTSSLNPADLEKTLALVNSSNVKIAVLGVGGETTTAITNSDGGYIKDKNGSLMMTTLPVDNLKKLALSTNSIYRTIALDDSDIHQFADEFSAKFADRHLNEASLGLKKWQDQGYLFVLLAIPFVSLIFRRGVLVAFLAMMPYCADASIWSDYFQTPDARAQELYRNEDYLQAKETFENSDWKATSHYQLKEYEQAAELFQLNQTADGLYNYGTARAKHGDFEKALEAYSKVLEIKPDHEDALYNKKIIEEYQKEQQQQNQKDKQKDKNSKDKDKNKEKDKDSDDKSDESDEDEAEGDKSEDKEQTEESDKEPESKDQDSEEDKDEKEDLKDEFKDKVDKELSENEDKKETEEIAKNEPKEDDSPSDKDLQRDIDERWLQHVKDDPGGLLRRKFLHQYNRTKGARK